jgi:TonB family protein
MWLAALSLLLTVATSPAAAPASAPTAGDRRPVPLIDPPLMSPMESAGTGIAPEVTVKAEVDARGHVARVEVLAIRPASALDEAFRKAAVETLSRWRFAPAIEGGLPVPATLQWTILFRPLGEGEVGATFDDAGGVRGLSTRFTADEDPRRRILELPVEQQMKYLGELAAKADALVDVQRRREFKTPAFHVVTDSADAKLTELIAHNLQAVYGTLARWFGDRVQPGPARGHVLVYVWDREESYRTFGHAAEQGLEGSAGFYSPPGLIAFHRQLPLNSLVLSGLIHETVHAFVDRHLNRPGVGYPRWLGEGLAEYVANSTIDKGRLVPGKVPRAIPVMEWGRQGIGFGKSHQALSFEEVKGAIRKGTAIPLDKLVSAGPQEFYGERIRLFYPQSWLFVHFLRHGRAEWTDQSFPLFLLYMSEGFDAGASFRAAYGCQPADLEGAFREYVRAF